MMSPFYFSLVALLSRFRSYRQESQHFVEEIYLLAVETSQNVIYSVVSLSFICGFDIMYFVSLS